MSEIKVGQIWRTDPGYALPPVEAPFFVWLDINHPNWRDRQDYELWHLGQLLAAYQAGQAAKQ